MGIQPDVRELIKKHYEDKLNEGKSTTEAKQEVLSMVVHQMDDVDCGVDNKPHHPLCGCSKCQPYEVNTAIMRDVVEFDDQQ